MTKFILMLTKNDLTIPNALDTFEEVKNTPVRHVGFKDVGVPVEELKTLVARIKKTKAGLEIDGINLLAYRYDGDVEKLTTSLVKAVNIPIIAAGSIDSFEKIRKMVQLGVDGFTIGGAIVDRKFVPDGSVSDQVDAVLSEPGVS